MVSTFGLLGDPGAGRTVLTEPEVLGLSVGMLLIAGKATLGNGLTFSFQACAVCLEWKL
jgi:hypothetical protein